MDFVFARQKRLTEFITLVLNFEALIEETFRILIF